MSQSLPRSRPLKPKLRFIRVPVTEDVHEALKAAAAHEHLAEGVWLRGLALSYLRRRGYLPVPQGEHAPAASPSARLPSGPPKPYR